MKWFIDHPASVGETYTQHLGYAMSMGIVLIVLGIVLIIHSIFPFLFKQTVSNWMDEINQSMKNRRNGIDT